MEVSTGRDGPCSRNRTLPAMSGKFREALFASLCELSEVIPEIRTGQLMATVRELYADLHGRGLWDGSDLELLEAVWHCRRNFEAATVRTDPQETQP